MSDVNVTDHEEAELPDEARDAENARARERKLDEALEHTFPASDPLPWIHEAR